MLLVFGFKSIYSLHLYYLQKSPLIPGFCYEKFFCLKRFFKKKKKKTVSVANLPLLLHDNRSCNHGNSNGPERLGPDWRLGLQDQRKEVLIGSLLSETVCEDNLLLRESMGD